MSLDDTDVKLLKELSKDGRMSFRTLAKKTGVSTVTVLNRVNKLKESGVLKGFTTRIDAGEAGYSLTALVNIRVKGGHLIEVEKKIAENQHVLGVYDITGEFDAVIVTRFKSINDLNKFVKTALSMQWVEHTQTQVVLNVMKEDYGVKF